MTDIKKYKGKKTKTGTAKSVIVRLNEEAYKKIKEIAVKCECTLSDAITEHLTFTK